jgi:hypothetical protein
VTSRRPSEQGPADIEIGAAARARRLRFKRKPETRVEFTGEADIESDSHPGIETDSHTERENLPEEVEPGKVYRDVKVGWIAGARIGDADVRRLEQRIGPKRRKKGNAPSKES